MSTEAYLAAAVVFLNGLVIGSYLNVVIHRIPRGATTFRNRSRCPRCDTPIKWYDNIPLLSFVVLRGRCRACGKPISLRYPLVELLTAALFLGVFLHEYANLHAILSYEFLATTVAYLYFMAVLVAATFIDAEHRIIPNRITYPAVVIGPLLLISADPSRWRGVLLGAAIGGGVLFLIGLVRKAGMGGGDIKLGLVMGIFLGAPVAVALFVASLTGAVFGLALVAQKKRGLKDALEFGPFLALGSVVAYFWGASILDWYLKTTGLF